MIAALDARKSTDQVGSRAEMNESAALEETNPT
jgi:hypothetical protein